MTQAQGVLTVSGIEAVRDLIESKTLKPIDWNQIDLKIDPSNSEWTLEARAFDPQGIDGQYIGSMTGRYIKADLSTLLPAPLFIDRNYPLSYRQLADALQAQYGIVIEEMDFALASHPYLPLSFQDQLSEPLEETSGMVELVSTVQSIRFQPGQRIRLLFAKQANKGRLQQQFRQSKTAYLDDLARGWGPQNGQTLFAAEQSQWVSEVFRRQFGLELERDQIKAIVRSVDHTTGQILLLPRFYGISPWTGSAQIQYEKADLTTLIPEPLPVNLPYPTTFQALASYLLQSYSLRLEPRTFSVGHYGNPSLAENDPVNVPLEGFAYLKLYAKKRSTRWKAKSFFTVQFLDSRSANSSPRITNDPPEIGASDTVWTYQPIVDGGTPPYRLMQFGTAPLSLNPDTAGYEGLPAPGEYRWMVIAIDANQRVGVRTVFTSIEDRSVPPLPNGLFYSYDDSGYFADSDNDVGFVSSDN